MMGNNQNLFFSQEEKGRAFSDVLKEVQEYISSKYSTLMVEGGNDEVKQQVKRYISKYIADYRITVKGKTREELINDLYTEMAEFSFLTKYIFGTGIEEIDINSWKDIEVQYSDGRCEKMEEHFESPEHAINVIRRMLHVSGMVLDNASPAVLGHLSKNIRIAVLKTPLVDEDVGIAASIRIVNPQSLKKSDFVDGGTATDEMLDFLAECLRYGISICVAGATSSGKTTLAGWLLTTIPDNKRIFTIENGSRELALVREKDGKVTNSVIHTLTRFSENEKQNIDQDMLLDMALRFNPEIICVGEMRSSEAYTAQESARTGHTVLTRDVLSMLEHYKENAGAAFRKELDIVCADMRSSSYEAALTRFEARLNSPQLSDVVRGLIGVLRGDDGAVYFQMLTHDFKQTELQRLKAKAAKIPPKIRVYSFAMLMCFLATYFAIIIYEIIRSMGTLF